MKWQKVLLPLTVVMVIGVIACQPLAAEKQITIRFSGWGASSKEIGSYQAMFKEFEREYPQYRVSYEPINKGYYSKITEMIESKTAPDVFYVSIDCVTLWIEEGYPLPLNRYVKQEDREDFIFVLLDSLMYEGDIYGIPKDFSVLGMFYNKEMFKKAGIREVPDTWDELLAVAKKLKKAGLVPMSVSSDLSTWLAFIYQKGAEIITPDYKHSLFTDPRIVESLEFYALFWV